MIILFFGIAQVLTGQNPAPATQDGSEGLWKDSTTGLIWTVKDNGSAVNHGQARDYCSNLRLSGYSDWRLPTIDEMEAIYDSKASKQYKARGPIELGDACAVSGTTNSSGEVWSFCFNYGGRTLERATGHGSNTRALCVRRAGE